VQHSPNVVHASPVVRHVSHVLEATMHTSGSQQPPPHASPSPVQQRPIAQPPSQQSLGSAQSIPLGWHIG
jgi:hypothetical protein